MLTRTTIAAAACGLFAAPAFAQIPPDVQAMIDAAIATGDEAKVETVLDLAKQTQPDSAEEIEALGSAWRAEQDEAKRIAELEQQQEIKEAGIFQLWSGEGQIGAFLATGNSENIGVTAALDIKREGIDWTHAFRASADYQRSNGVTSREQFQVAYEPRYEMGENLFAFGIAQFERDRFQGFNGRYSLSGGLGYTVIDNDSASLSVKGGPAFRVTERIDGISQSRIGGLLGVDFDWRIADRITFTQDANAVAETGGEALVIIDGANTTVNLVSGLDFKISDALRSRLSYQLEYNSNPGIGAESTDTLTRFTLVYGF